MKLEYKKGIKMFLAGLLGIGLVFTETAIENGNLQTVDSVFASQSEEETLDILFLHDTHSHLDSFATIEQGESTIMGGFSRLQTLIQQQKEKNPETLILDGGDFSMGTLVQTIFEQEAAELRMLGMLGCDVTTLGNHEFDYRSEGLANMMEAAAKIKEPVPEMVVCNVDWAGMEKKGLSEEQQMLKDAFDAYGVADYTVIEKEGIQIAVIGVFGEDSLACAPTCVLEFESPITAVKRAVEEISQEEDVDMLICVSHSGTSEDESKSEDELLAKAVPELDLIISAHTHTMLEEPIVHGNTTIASCGEYGKYLGSLSLTKQTDGSWKADSYELIPVTEEVAQDEETQEKIDDFMGIVDKTYLAQYGYERSQVLAENEVNFCTVSDLHVKHTEGNLGNLIADAYVYAVEQAIDFDGVPVDIAVAPSGTIRETYAIGDITVEDVFNSFSLGIGADGIPGYPLLSIYLTGKELKVVAEIDASVSDFMQSARLYNSGLNFSYNPHRMILNKVTDCYLTDNNGNRREIEDNKLYRVVSDLYSGQMLGAVTDISYGLLSIVPKDANGKPFENLEDAIIKTDGKELKAWTAIASYMESFEDSDGNGVPNVPESYGEVQGRKVVEDSKNIIDLIKKPNRYAAMIIGIVVIVIVFAVGIGILIRKGIRWIFKKEKRKEKNKKK